MNMVELELRKWAVEQEMELIREVNRTLANNNTAPWIPSGNHPFDLAESMVEFIEKES